jgi:hypothetical protein
MLLARLSRWLRRCERIIGLKDEKAKHIKGGTHGCYMRAIPSKLEVWTVDRGGHMTYGGWRRFFPTIHYTSVA